MTAWSSRSTEPRPVPSGRTVAGALRPPSSKSLTQRYFLLAALAEGPTVVRRPLVARDTECSLAALQRIGVGVEHVAGAVRLVPRPAPAAAAVDCGENGTLLRLLTATLSTRPGRWRLDGRPGLRRRPVAPLVEALRALGARIAWEGEPGYAPLTVAGGSLEGGEVTLDAGLSSQFLSAVLIAATQAPHPTDVRVVDLVSTPYVNLTIDSLGSFGGRVERTPAGFRVPGRQRLRGCEVTVEPDASAACYPAAAAALTGGRVVLLDLFRGSSQGDVRFFELLAAMGATVCWTAEGVEVTGPPGLAAVEADLADLPDQAPTLAALAPFAAGRTRIAGVPHLRHKESDRLSAMTEGLRRMGAVVEQTEDGWEIPGTWAAQAPAGAVEVDAAGDHRIAMSLAVAGLRRPGVRILGWRSVAKSYPAFWEDLEELLAP
jgi:3-phosphoshikimate 1-carboxyvinyltransferase